MSRTKKGGKSFGHEFWAGRGGGIVDGWSAGGHTSKKYKTLTHKRERRLQTIDLRKQLKDV
jgi:hypothetical protein